MLNGAVVGLVPWLRYVLLTDALIDVLPREQLVAVMAHEVGHVRRRHMLVSALGLLACAALGSFAVDGAVAALRSSVPVQPGDAGGPSEWIDLGGMVVAAALTLVGFGVVSRRLERQADTFAVAHLSSSSDRMVLPAAVDAMCGALAAVSSSSGVDPGRRSYRHGSIASRQAYLRSIEGAPTQGLAIDRQVRWMTLASAIIVAVALALSW
ncbi:MAG: M48 family metalloprotease [Phycisphaerales bacterium]